MNCGFIIIYFWVQEEEEEEDEEESDSEKFEGLKDAEMEELEKEVHNIRNKEQ